MGNTLRIMTKEWKTFFHTPFAMMVLPLYCVLCGSYFSANVNTYLTFARPNESLQDVGVVGLNVMGFLLVPFFESLFNVFVLIVPLITMRVFSEERKAGTYELLVSYPISPWEILIGKYLGVVGIILCLLGGSGVYPLIVAHYGHPYLPQIASIYFGYGLFMILYAAIGIWASLLTENQLVAAVITYAAFFLSFLIGYLAHLVGAPFDALLTNFLVIAHIQSFRAGLIYLGDVAALVCGTVLFMVLAYWKLRRHYVR